MERFDKMAEELDPYLITCLEQALTSATADYEYQKNHYLRSFQEKLYECARQASNLQRGGEKGEIRYFAISMLQSGLLAETYEVRFDLQDNRGFMDSAESYSYWVPKFIRPYMELDKNVVQSILSGKILRVMPYELYEIQHVYRSLLLHSLVGIMKELAEQSIPTLKELDGEPVIWVLYGNYMEDNGYVSKIQIKEFDENEILLDKTT